VTLTLRREDIMNADRKAPGEIKTIESALSELSQ